MTVLRFLTAGESHGPTLMGIIEGMPAHLDLVEDDVNRQLARRQKGYGRGGRMAIETDTVQILSGVRWGKTLGGPIGLAVVNRDWENWQDTMAIGPPTKASESEPMTRPRPGHGDLAGMLKYRTKDARNILERASARETAMRVAVGAVARRLLEHFGMVVSSHVVQIGDVMATDGGRGGDWIREKAETSPLRCADDRATEQMMAAIDHARATGDSLGGIFEIIAEHVPAGLGSHVHWDRRLDGRLGQALMSIPAIKAVEIGMGRESGLRPGSQVHDEIHYHGTGADCKREAFYWQGRHWPTAGGFYRSTNRAGGIEGGMTNGSPIVVRATMKPIPTLYKPLSSVDLDSLEPIAAGIERSDVCAVPAAAVVGEAMVSWVLAEAFLEKFGGDSVKEIEASFKEYLLSLCPGQIKG
ncbi:MAG: chorismate synthase [Firmicutes bacterium]|nr:chorismate synthase [Bacillota bacterium]